MSHNLKIHFKAFSNLSLLGNINNMCIFESTSNAIYLIYATTV